MTDKSVMTAEHIYSGHKALDRDHEILAQVTEKFRAHPEEFPTLRSYALVNLEAHFGHEEDLMRRCEYPGFAIHKSAHDLFLAEMSALESKDACVWADRLEEWLTNHILGIDQLLANFLQEYDLSPVG